MEASFHSGGSAMTGRRDGRGEQRGGAKAPAVTREIGRRVGKNAGPTLITIGGIHGNEPAGILAAQRVFARLEKGDVDLRGELLALRGNMGAGEGDCRYIEKDLNRVWSEDSVEQLRKAKASASAAGKELGPEDKEQLELLRTIEEAIGRARGVVYLVDMHTTSAKGIPFVIFGDTLAQRQLVSRLPIPIIIGLEEQVDGVLSEYWTRRGCVTFATEGGQHDDPGSIDNLEAILLVTMEAAGLIPANLPEVANAYALLEKLRGTLPRVMEVVSRHAIKENDGFRMEPGFRNLDHAKQGQLLARDRRGEIRAESDGLVIMPLYQGQGTDGFFWGREPSTTRLWLTERLRQMKFERLLGLLPGVSKDPAGSRFVVDTAIARLYPLEVFHMFGYRRIRERDGKLIVERQPGD